MKQSLEVEPFNAVRFGTFFSDYPASHQNNCGLNHLHHSADRKSVMSVFFRYFVSPQLFMKKTVILIIFAPKKHFFL